MTGTARQVVIAGGGVGALEAALALRAQARDRVAITMVADQTHFLYRPLAVGVPFGGAAAVRVELAAVAAERGFELRRDRIAALDLDAGKLMTDTGQTHGYDDLVLALGARPQEAVAGALTFRGPRDVERFTLALRELEERDAGRVVFVARSATDWTLPMYELALMTANWAAERELALDVAIVTPEAAPLELFGEEASEDVRRLLDAHQIDLYLGTVADTATAEGLWIPMEGQLRADLVVAMPVLVGPDVPGLPTDALGFVAVDDFCRVRDVATSVYAVGDMASHPVKQGGLAAQQADVAAACIAAAAGVTVRPEPYEPVLRAMLFTGQAPRFLRSPAIVGSEGLPGDGSAVPWWPAHKIVGRHLAPYLATHAELMEPLDRP